MTQTIRDDSGRILYRILANGSVTTASGKLLGRIRNGHTENSRGRIVARSVCPGILLNG